MRNHHLYLSARVVILFLLMPLTAFTQRKKSAILRYDQTGHHGRVVLTDGSVYEGTIVFNDNDGIVTVTEGGDSRSFTSRKVNKFEYYNEATNRRYRFYSLWYDDVDTGIGDFYFFEVLKDLGSFAVLVKIDPIKTESQKKPLRGRDSPLLVDNNSKKFTQTHTVFFVDGKGEFKPYVKIVEKEIEGDLLDINETNNRYVDPSLMQKFTGAHYPALVEYAKQNKLSFKRKSDLARILDKYEELLVD